ncbi:MAG: ComEA family DNA-binding protein [Halieaceae bacterium]|jgi:competence protein ComEA|nr:ComEA family DNA-binding protein [Halieaceae bacterium]
MTYSKLLDRYSRPAPAAGRSFLTTRLPAAVVLAMTLTLMAGILPGGASAAYAQDKAPPPAVAVVNINKADAATLASALKGVGTSRAQEIVRYREAYGPFKSVDELADVKGIGKSTLDDNRTRITLE